MPKETPRETPTDSPKPMKEEKGVNSEELETVKGRISKLEKDVMNLHEKVETTHIIDAANLENMASKVQEMQGDVEKLTQITDNLIDERETREMHFSVSIFDHLTLLIILKNFSSFICALLIFYRRLFVIFNTYLMHVYIHTHIYFFNFDSTIFKQIV